MVAQTIGKPMGGCGRTRWGGAPPPHTPAGDKSPTPHYWGFAPRKLEFVGAILL